LHSLKKEAARASLFKRSTPSAKTYFAGGFGVAEV
jgi:hypothetical protein